MTPALFRAPRLGRLGALVLPALAGLLLAGVLLAVVQPPVARAGVVCVRPGGGGGCYPGLNAAILAIPSGTIVRVARGVYTENVYLNKNLVLEGGWNDDFSARDPQRYPTYLRPGDVQGSVVWVDGFSGAVTPTIDGFHISGARLVRRPFGAVYLLSTNALFQNNVVYDNVGTGRAGGIGVRLGAPTLRNNLVLSNTGTAGATGFGGGLFVDTGAAYLYGNVFNNNLGGPSGGGGALGIGAGSAVTMSANRFENNAGALSGSGDGGAIWLDSGAVLWSTGDVLTGNVAARSGSGRGGGLFARGARLWLAELHATRNRAPGGGGALAVLTGTLVVARNSRWYANTAAEGAGLYAQAGSGWLINNTLYANTGEGVAVTGASSVFTLTNNIIQAHVTGARADASGALVTSDYNLYYANGADVSGPVVRGSHDRSGIDPLLTDPARADFHLLPGSPAVDAGTPEGAPARDFEGGPRPAQGGSGLYRYDVGADELGGPAQTVKDLLGGADYTIYGPGGAEGGTDWIGPSLAAGDLNGDGRVDLVAGAPEWSSAPAAGIAKDGRAFGIFGAAEPWQGVRDLLLSPAELEVVSGLPEVHAAAALATGDLNGDGEADLLIGGHGSEPTGSPDVLTATVHVLFGAPGLGGTQTITAADVTIIAEAASQGLGAREGRLVAGRVNADALDDLVAGDPTGSGPFTRPEAGAVFVLFGRSSWPSYYDLGAQPADLTVYGAQPGDGLSQAILGDLSGDDQPDLIMRTRGITTAVLFGPRAAGIVDLAVTPPDVLVTGPALAGHGGGLAVGDVNGDGDADLALGAIDPQNGTGAVYVVYGPLPAQVVLPGAADVTLTGAPGAQLGAQLAAAQLFGSPADELVASAPGADGFLRPDAGALYVLRGGGLPGTADIAESAQWHLQGAAGADLAGTSLEVADFNRDGWADLALGTQRHALAGRPPDRSDAGAVYVVYAPRYGLNLPALFRR